MGATKTASTYLQKCLRLNEEVLAKHGVYLPQAGRRASSSNLNHHNLAWHLLEDRRFRGVNGDWDALRREVAEAAAEIVLLSSEAFARLASEERLRPMLAKRLFEISDDVTLVYVVRDPLARINSMYTQVVKTFATPDSFDEYATQSVKSGFYNLEDSFRFWYQESRATFVSTTSSSTGRWSLCWGCSVSTSQLTASRSLARSPTRRPGRLRSRRCGC